MNENLSRIVENWITIANEDLAIAKRELSYSDDEIFPRAVFFHSHEGIEKYLKAFLVKCQRNFRKSHDLEYLKELCSAICNEFEKLDLDILLDYSVEIRYPDEPSPSLKEAKEAYEVAERTKQFILKKLKDF